MSVKGFARDLGVSPRAVRRAAADGRLTEGSVGRDRRGHLLIRDAERARREWTARTRPRVDYRTAGRGQVSTVAPPNTPRLAHPVLAAFLDLRGLLGDRVHPALHAWLKDCARRIPTAPATSVRAVFEAWYELPAALARLEDELATTIPLFAEEEE